jgi:hypothetical protein
LPADAIREGLARAGLPARGPPKRTRVPLGQVSLPFPEVEKKIDDAKDAAQVKKALGK